MCRASLGSVVEGSEFTIEGRPRMEAERAMGHGRLMARAKGVGGLWLVRQRCRDVPEALLLIQGGVHWCLDLGDLILGHGVH